ncbi:hypothetical protein VCHENC02_0474A, partial [Vibrio harveyi]
MHDACVAKLFGQ